jgi:ABC-type protease/lipase transport system fused ATPase/permease subunit
MNSQSPIYSFKFTISWIFIYIIIIYLLSFVINVFIAAYLGLWILNLLIELAERFLLRFGKRIDTVER